MRVGIARIVVRPHCRGQRRLGQIEVLPVLDGAVIFGQSGRREQPAVDVLAQAFEERAVAADFLVPLPAAGIHVFDHEVASLPGDLQPTTILAELVIQEGIDPDAAALVPDELLVAGQRAIVVQFAEEAAALSIQPALFPKRQILAEQPLLVIVTELRQRHPGKPIGRPGRRSETTLGPGAARARAHQQRGGYRRRGHRARPYEITSVHFSAPGEGRPFLQPGPLAGIPTRGQGRVKSVEG